MQTNFELPIQTTLFRTGKPVAQELTASRDQYRKWVAIYKNKGEDSMEPVSAWEFVISIFEIDKENVDENFGPDEMYNIRRYYAKDQEELREKLYQLNIDLSKFTYPWKCDYPL
jgi:hypothetical protein